MASSEQQENQPLQDSEHYVPKSSINAGVNTALVTGGAGTFVSAIQNSLSEHKRGAMGVFTRGGKTIGVFAATGGAYAFTEAAVSNARESNDAISAAAGGCAMGLVAGASAGSLPMMAGSCLAIGALMGTFRATGNALSGPNPVENPHSVGAAIEGAGHENAGIGERGWREERERRRQRFFKQPKETESSN
ncbi:unnamed protein product [Parajaminaea phylloscopi]